jgi:hypothetical protein
MPTGSLTPETARRRASHARLTQSYPPDHAKVVASKQALEASKAADRIEAIVADWPELSGQRLDRVAALLRAGRSSAAAVEAEAAAAAEARKETAEAAKARKEAAAARAAARRGPDDDKRCSRRGAMKPADYFGPDERASDGLRSSCRGCETEDACRRYREKRDTQT